MKETQRRAAPLTGRRLLVGGLALVMTAGATWVFGQGLAAAGGGVLVVPLVALFAVLFLWVSLSFWLATAGFFRLLRRKPPDCGGPTKEETALEPGVRTAILMPVYNEDPHRVFAGLRAIYESLQATGHGAAFDIFVLSDTTNPDLWLAEELHWARLNQVLTGPSRVFYRHRPRNVGRKAGNIADFCERWGSAYRYMIVLDADSVMSGTTLVEMVRRMEQDPEVGILQVPPVPVNRVSLFARCQQFAAGVYGPVFVEGFAWCAHSDGNYVGHNAIIRVEPFTRHCGLSPLPGPPPLGGEILSHDFVEAALMRRAGLKVCLAHDLGGSYEESPPTLIDYARRDQRWCQGNMQHLRLVFSYGLPPMSRLHMGMGAMAYLSSPLWLIFLVLSFLPVAMRPTALGVWWQPAEAAPAAWWAAGPLFATTMALLLLPKLWGYVLLLRDPPRLAGCGGALRALASVVMETVVSILVAPIMMAFHATFVVATFLGVRVGWDAQQRRERGQRFRAALAAHWKQTAAGLAAAGLVGALAPALLLWLSPVLGGLILAVPLSMLLSSVPLGQALARVGLLVTPEETAPPRVLRRLRRWLTKPAARELTDSRAMFRRVLAEPAFAALHHGILLATGGHVPADPRQVRRAEEQVRAGAPHRVSADDRRAVLSDASALPSLQLAPWTAN